MMNPPSTTHTIAPPGISSRENRGYADPSHGHPASYYPPAAGYDSSSWTAHRADSYSVQNPVPSSSPYNFEQPSQAPVGESLNGPTAGSTSSSGTTAVPQEYNGYTTYQTSADSSHGYGTTGYTSYYSGYQQQTNQSYTQPTGTYPNTGVYQPLSSFQNTGSYAVPASYSSTYYNPGDYQTSGGYPTQTSSYNNQNQNQTTQWNGGNYANYTNYQYPNYPQATTSSYASSSAPQAPVHYQQQYSQSYSQPEVTCAPGTENLPVTAKSSLEGTVPGVTIGYSTPTIQPPQPSVPSWRPEAIPSQQPAVQSSTVASAAHDGYWSQSAPSFTNQNHPSGPGQSELYQPFDSKPIYSSLQDQQNTSFAQPQGYSVQYPVAHQVPRSHQPIAHQVPQSHQPVAHQVPQSHQSIAHQVPQSHQSIAHQAPQTHQSIQQTSSVEKQRVSSFQIQSNPRIASNMGLYSAKTDKVSSYPSVASKPAYISVTLPKPSDQASTDTADSTLKSGLFPKSLKGYVERALARCKDESQLVACQAVMKEIITSATSDGTLHTRDWDIEPLFPLPDAGRINTELQFPSPGLAFKRSPSKRAKSRWEPLPEEKPLEKSPFVSSNNMRYSGWEHMKERDRKSFSINNNSQSKDDGTSAAKFSAVEQNNVRPPKRQRLVDKADNGGDGSSDSDKEQNLSSYYTGGISVANTPEERKRRESRSKRFEKAHGGRTEANHYKPKGAGAASLYSRRATAMLISKNFEPGGSDEAVEDIDWDSLTVKGTCQEIEKRYLRLTSAPDPSTVRPEDVLEKALLMVQSSPKNYLYKCDQLKSIRQDLTVQRIRNHLTVKVYETHARLALEAGDLPEFNQCQSQLKTLYAEGIDGCRMEFSAYGLLCVIMHSNNNRDLVSLMSRLSVDSKEDEAVKHALAVRAAVTSGNYVMFFRLYKTSPNLNACLMDLYVDKMRYKAVTCMSKTYRPTIPVSYIAQVLGFAHTNEIGDEKQQDGLEECIEWLKAHGACLITDNNGEMELDTKASSSSLYIPEPDDAVAHGDANLAVNDFFARTLS